MVLRSTPLLILMGRKSVEVRKEKMPLCPENNCWGSMICAVDYRFGRAVSSALQNKKGGSDPLSLFGPQAGRKEGVAPALLPYLAAYGLRGLRLVLYCLIGG
jgi:hypothetical protein